MPPARPPAAPHKHSHPRSPNEHLIQFYNGEDTLFDAISSFILPSFFSNEHAAVIVATKPHLEALDLYLRQQNLVPELLRKREQMFLAPAELILEQLMPNGVVEERIFFEYFGPLFQKLQKRYPRLLVYGELVNILCENGEYEKAHELEEVWESFLAGRDAALLCGYNLNVFAGDGLEDVFQRICRSHSHVTPAESAGGGGLLARPEDQQMMLAMLQQKNLRLEAEMGRRAAVEMALRSTLDHLGARPTDAIQTRERDGSLAHISLSPVGIMAATTIDGITEYFFNAKFLELTGLTGKLAKMDPGWVGAVHYQDRDRVSHNIRLVDGKSRRLEYRFVLPDGTIRWVVGESVSRESGYVHTAVDISQLRVEIPIPSARSRTGSVVAAAGAGAAAAEESGWMAPPAGWKRTIALSRVSSPSGTVSRSGQSIFTRTRPNDQKIAHDLARMAQLLWDNLFPHPPLHHPASPDPAESNIAAKLTALYTWSRSQSPAFVPDSSAAFDINNDALQRANIRLAHIACLGSIILLSRYPLVRSIERGDKPRDTAQPRRDAAPGRRKNELDDLQYAEGCIDAAERAIEHVNSLVSPISPSCLTTSAVATFADDDSGVRDVRSSRTVLGVFFVATLTVLLNMSLHPSDSQKNERLLGKIQQTQGELESHAETQEVGRHYCTTLEPFIAAVSARSPSPYTNPSYPHGHHHHHPSTTSAGNTSTGPLSVAGKRLIADLSNLLKQPLAGTEWFSYRSPQWSWRDLLATPGAPPVGGRMLEMAASPASASDHTLRGGDGSETPPRGADKRARTEKLSQCQGAEEDAAERERKWKVSKELEALFERNNSRTV